jgi:hypothetical protein
VVVVHSEQSPSRSYGQNGAVVEFDQVRPVVLDE